MYSEEYQPHIQQNGNLQNPQDFGNEEYETEYESDNQFQPETLINPDLQMNGPPTLRSVTPGSKDYGFGKSRPFYDPHFEFNYDTKTMTEEEKAKLKLHQGSVCQFPEKNPNPNYKNELAEYSHVDEASKYMIPKTTVQQFPEKNPNPNYKNELAEYSHVDEATKYMIPKTTVAQFQKKVPDFNHMKGLPQKSHMPEEEIYNKKQTHNLLQLHQGSVLQQPRHGDYEHVRKYMAYRPKPDSLREEMPVARLPNRIPLPSQVKKMQTYITHPSSKTIRSIGFTSSEPNSPTLSRKNIWPPSESTVKQLPRTGFNPNVMYKEDDTRKHVWPPTSSNKFGSLNDINEPIPTIGQGPVAGVWNPDPDGTNRSGSNYYTRFNPQQKLHAVWPPNRGSSMINLSSSQSNPKSVRLGESDTDYIHHSINSSIPFTYRCPPNTQFYRTPYMLSDENNNQLNEKLEQRIPNLGQADLQELNRNLDESYFDNGQHLGVEPFFQQQQIQNQQQQQQYNQQLQQPLNRSANNSPSPIHFDQQNSSFSPQQTDIYTKQQIQQKQLREFERQQAEKINRQQQQNRSHHLPKTNVNSNNLINNEEIIQHQFSQSPQPPIYRPISPRQNIYQQQKPSTNQQLNQQETLNQQMQYIQQPTIVKSLQQEQTYREEMQKQYYIQN